VSNSIKDRIAESLDQSDEYAGDDAPPFAPYATLAALFNTWVAAVLWRNDRVPKLSAGDVVMMTVATHKLSRTITKDKVTSFVRAPFTRLEGPAGHGELDEKPRGDGVRLPGGHGGLPAAHARRRRPVHDRGRGRRAAPRLPGGRRPHLTPHRRCRRARSHHARPASLPHI
jgi:Protein of unknown function (DUF1360)